MAAHLSPGQRNPSTGQVRPASDIQGHPDAVWLLWPAACALPFSRVRMEEIGETQRVETAAGGEQDTGGDYAAESRVGSGHEDAPHVVVGHPEHGTTPGTEHRAERTSQEQPQFPHRN